MRFFAWLMRDSAARGWTNAVVDLQLLQRLLDDGELVGGVVDDEVARQPDGGASRRSSRAQSEWNVEIHIAGAVGAEQRLDARRASPRRPCS